jgi:hypothetical protein
MAGTWHLVRGRSPSRLPRYYFSGGHSRDFPRVATFFRGGVKKGPENPISVGVSGESGGARDQPP